MRISTDARREAYLLIKPKMNRQEAQVYDFLIHNGPANAWTISERLGQLITSTRRALFDLRKKCWIQESGKEFCAKTGANVTVWEALPELPLHPIKVEFDETGQKVFE